MLLPIDDIRSSLILGVALIKDRDRDYSDLPMGVDAVTNHDAIFMAGVFSMTAMMVVLDVFEEMMPEQFGRYYLAPRRQTELSVKLFYPPVAFPTGVEAVGVTRLSSLPLSRAHDEHALKLAGRLPRGGQ